MEGCKNWNRLTMSWGNYYVVKKQQIEALKVNSRHQDRCVVWTELSEH
jgi:hypothetical protein